MSTEIKIQGEMINQRPEKTQLDGAESILIQDSEGTKQAKASTLKTFSQPDLSGYAKKTKFPTLPSLPPRKRLKTKYQARE